MKRRRDTAAPWTQRQDPSPRDPGDERPDANARVRVGTGHRKVPVRYDEAESEDPQEFGRWPQTWGER